MSTADLAPPHDAGRSGRNASAASTTAAAEQAKDFPTAFLRGGAEGNGD